MKATLTNKSIRNNNCYNILNALLKHHSLQRSELTKESNVSVMTVKKIVDDLLARGILVEIPTESTVGRKPKALKFDDKFGCFGCIDLTSKNKINYFVYDLYSKKMAEESFVITDYESYVEVLKTLMVSMEANFNRTKLVPLGIAISVPSIYYSDTDEVNYDLIPGFKGLHLKDLFYNHFHLDNILIMHDVNAVAIDEYKKSGASSLYYFYIGDGVGGSLVKDGELIAGENLAAGEIGQCLISTSSGYATLENAISAVSISQRVEDCIKVKLDFSQIIRRYYDKDSTICSIVDEAIDHALQFIYNLCWIINPSIIIIDSNYYEYAKLIVASAEKCMSMLSTSPIKNSTVIRLPYTSNHYNMLNLLDLLKDNWIVSISNLT